MLNVNINKFTGLADNYAKYRPSYNKEFIDYLYTDIGLQYSCKIADIGAGTGIFSRLLLERGSKVTCVEPNSDMMKQAQDFLKGFDVDFISAPAESTTLPAQSVDFITAAQAFHWFDEEKFKVECQRILKNTGKVILIWNTKVFGAETIAEFDEVTRKYCPDFKGFSGGMRGNVPDNHASFFKDGIVECKTFRNDFTRDYESFIGNCLSASYALKKGEEKFDEYISELTELFNKHSINGFFTMPNVTECYIGEV